MSVITLYRIPQVIELTTGTGASLMNYPVNRTDFTVFRYVDNEIDILVRNIDRKPIDFTGCSATIHILDSRAQRLLTVKTLTIVDADQGHLRLTLTGDEAAALPKKPLAYRVTMTRADAVTQMLFTDKNRNPTGVVHVEEGPTPDPKEAVTLLWEDFLPRNKALYAATFQGSEMVGNETGLHSVTLDLDAFKGSFTVEGSNQLSPSQTDGDWFEVVSSVFDEETGSVHIPFEDKLMWVRFKIKVVRGKITEVVYRN